MIGWEYCSGCCRINEPNPATVTTSAPRLIWLPRPRPQTYACTCSTVWPATPG